MIIFVHQIYCIMHIWVMVDLLKYLMVKHVASFNLSCNKFLCKQGSVAIVECLRHHFTLMMQREIFFLKVIITSFINSMKANPETQICFSICPHNVCFEWGESLWRMHFFSTCVLLQRVLPLLAAEQHDQLDHGGRRLERVDCLMMESDVIRVDRTRRS